MEIIMSSIVPARASLLSVAAMVSLVAGSAVAVAQEQGTEQPGMMGRGMTQRGAMMCQMDQHIDGDLAFLKAELKISEAQTQQWNVFAKAFRADREKRARACREAMEQAKET